MALTKQQILDLIDKNCTQQGMVSIPGPVLKELVDNYIPVIAEQTLIADIAVDASGTLIATAVNSIIDALQANGIVATA